MSDKTEINQVIQHTWKWLICLWPLSTSTKQILALQCDCWVNILSRRSWFVLITEAYGTVCATARWLCGILHLALVTVVFHRDANHQACAGGMIKCHTAPLVLGLSLWINLPHPQAGEAWSLRPRSEQAELHRATAPPTGHTTEDNNNQVSAQTLLLYIIQNCPHVVYLTVGHFDDGKYVSDVKISHWLDIWLWCIEKMYYYPSTSCAPKYSKLKLANTLTSGCSLTVKVVFSS